MTRWKPGEPAPRGVCAVCGRDVALSPRGLLVGYHYEHPRGPLNPRGLPCPGQGRPPADQPK